MLSSEPLKSYILQQQLVMRNKMCAIIQIRTGVHRHGKFVENEMAIDCGITGLEYLSSVPPSTTSGHAVR